MKAKLELMDDADGSTCSVGESFIEAFEGVTARVGYGEEAAM